MSQPGESSASPSHGRVAPVGPVDDILRVGVLGVGETVFREYVVRREDVHAARESVVKILDSVHVEDWLAINNRFADHGDRLALGPTLKLLRGDSLR